MLKGKCQIQRDSPTTKDIIRQCSVAVRPENSTLCRWQHWRIFFGEKMKHGMYKTLTYYSWRNMISRCENPNVYNYKNYGGRGIKVCWRWHKFENFFEDMGEKPKNLTLERRNNYSHYEPNNCYWASHKTQHRNKRARGTTPLFPGFDIRSQIRQGKVHV